MSLLPRLCLPLLLWACAKVGPPAGGPVDKAPPAVVAHQPAADAVQVPMDTQVELVFSEAMERRRTEAALFLSPISPVAYQWQGRRLRLRFPQGLAADQTYVITLGTGARDLRGNTLAQSFTLAFATGAQLNQGRLEGRVFARQQPAGSAHVLAYRLGPGSRRLLADPPDYRTQTGSDGRYSFSRLPAGSYRLVAFADGDNDQAWDAGETLALPAADLALAEGATLQAGDLDLHPPAAAPQLQRVQPLDQQRLLFLFDQEVDPRQVEAQIQGLPVELQYQLADDRRKLYLRTAAQEAGRSYPVVRLTVAGQPVEWREPLRGNGRPDQTPPTLSTRPAAGGDLSPSDTLLLAFSEAMAQVEPAEVWVATDSTQAPAGRWQWRNPALLAFVPQTPWAPGAYRLQGRTTGLRDLAGLAPRDSIFTCSFAVAAEAPRLSGRVLSAAGTPVAAWVGIESGERRWRVKSAADGSYAFASLPPGTYRIFAFADANLNQQQDRGTLEPFLPSEPYACHPEALTLAASAVREGLELRLVIP